MWFSSENQSCQNLVMATEASRILLSFILVGWTIYISICNCYIMVKAYGTSLNSILVPDFVDEYHIYMRKEYIYLSWVWHKEEKSVDQFNLCKKSKITWITCLFLIVCSFCFCNEFIKSLQKSDMYMSVLLSYWKLIINCTKFCTDWR